MQVKMLISTQTYSKSGKTVSYTTNIPLDWDMRRTCLKLKKALNKSVSVSRSYATNFLTVSMKDDSSYRPFEVLEFNIPDDDDIDIDED